MVRNISMLAFDFSAFFAATNCGHFRFRGSTLLSTGLSSVFTYSGSRRCTNSFISTGNVLCCIDTIFNAEPHEHPRAVHSLAGLHHWHKRIHE